MLEFRLLRLGPSVLKWRGDANRQTLKHSLYACHHHGNKISEKPGTTLGRIDCQRAGKHIQPLRLHGSVPSSRFLVPIASALPFGGTNHLRKASFLLNDCNSHAWEPWKGVHRHIKSRASNAEGTGGSCSGVTEICLQTYQADAQRILELAIPIMAQNVFGYLLSIASTVAIGRLGASELAASSLANSIYIITGMSLIMGLSSAMEPLCGQAYGAKEYKVLGEVLQRAIVVCWVASIPVALLWSQSTALMVALGQDPAIAGMAGRYLCLLIPSLFITIAADCMRKYLQAQAIVSPGMYATAAAAAASPLFFYSLVHAAGLGLDGAALAFSLCQVTALLGVGGYILRHSKQNWGTPNATWSEFSSQAAFSKWGQYLKYGLPAMIMISLEWWCYQIPVVMNGWLPNAAEALSVGGICVIFNAWSYMVPMGLASAVNTCVGNALGSGDGQAARRVAMVGLCCALAIELCMASAVVGLGGHLVHAIATDPAVVELAIKTLPVLGFLIFWDGINATLAGILRGSGQQGVGAIVNAGCFFLAIPASYYLVFHTHWALLQPLPLLGGIDPVARVWLVVGACGMLQSGVLLSVITRWDWDAQARRVLTNIQENAKRGTDYDQQIDCK
ncbi:hypothetical protein CEUSTIGMA_g4319.t1 [Chlamydomonas eustigma]|uniref:Protein DETOXIFICATION n=1 Tax=Chlamydomonas eustigma TaxID=1157962 RepID=A0A250X1B3_9CHLO|nr:hypothetical protein CEUSTIGMA_g4319.t1 [Chlamydomonas eustigma]|eukprot:GAX76873.1 hypothetical protein CEUSTIGMA_g4319.t1 [Chlamydomonas eustigma]